MTIERSGSDRSHLRAVALFLVAVAVAGCGRDVPGPDRSPGDLLSAELRALPDRARNPKTFRALFVEGAAPSEQQRPLYAKYGIHPSAPEIDGDTATVEVRIYDDRAGKDVGTV